MIDSSDTTADAQTSPEPYSAANADLDAVGTAWCSSSFAPAAYLQVDFGEVKVVCAVAVQGVFVHDNQQGFIKSFLLSFATSEVSDEWTQYYEEGGSVRVS